MQNNLIQLFLGPDQYSIKIENGKLTISSPNLYADVLTIKEFDTLISLYQQIKGDNYAKKNL